jgi:hypothetical protein
MMSTKKVISWVKWHNPYKLLELKDKESSDDGFNTEGSIDLLDDIDGENHKEPTNSGLVFFTPLGPVPLNENNDPGKIFNFWVGHTNFNISPKIKEIIRNSDGVEILNVYTRYRFRIGVGKVFSPKNVTRDINRKISEYFRSKEVQNEEQQESPTGVSIDNS